MLNDPIRLDGGPGPNVSVPVGDIRIEGRLGEMTFPRFDDPCEADVHCDLPGGATLLWHGDMSLVDSLEPNPDDDCVVRVWSESTASCWWYEHVSRGNWRIINGQTSVPWTELRKRPHRVYKPRDED